MFISHWYPHFCCIIFQLLQLHSCTIFHLSIFHKQAPLSATFSPLHSLDDIHLSTILSATFSRPPGPFRLHCLSIWPLTTDSLICIFRDLFDIFNDTDQYNSRFRFFAFGHCTRSNIQTHKPKQLPHLALNTWFLFLFTADTMHTLHLPLFSFLRFSTRHSYLIFRYLPMFANGLVFLSSSLSSNLSLRAHYSTLTHHFLWCLKCSWWLALLLCRTHFSLITRGPH